MRQVKTKSGYFKSICRFDFGRKVTESLIVNNICASTANRRKLKSRSRLIELPRNVNEQYINDYNPAILLVWD